MSLQELLREGQEAPVRLLSRLSQLLHTLSLNVLASPFDSRKNSWRD